MYTTGFNQIQQGFELIFLYFLFTLRLFTSCRMNPRWRILYWSGAEGTRGTTRKLQTDRTKRSGNNAGPHCLSQITANIDNPALRYVTTKIHVDVRETKRDERKRNARRGIMGKSEESPEE